MQGHRENSKKVPAPSRVPLRVKSRDLSIPPGLEKLRFRLGRCMCRRGLQMPCQVAACDTGIPVSQADTAIPVSHVDATHSIYGLGSGFERNKKRNYAYRNYRRNYGVLVIVTLLICVAA